MSVRRSGDSDYVRNDVCSGCGRWHDGTGQPLLGWQYGERFYELLRGRMPASTPTEPGSERYGFCVMGAPQ